MEQEFGDGESEYEVEGFGEEAFESTQKGEISEEAVYEPEEEVDEVLLTDEKLTPRFLSTVVGPFLMATADIQHIIDEIQGQPTQDVRVKSINQYSPINVSLEGASEALEQIKDTIVPWRRKHTKKIARLTEREKRVEIENKKAEILEKRARAAIHEAEAEKLTVEADERREKIEGMKLENEKLRIELYRAKIQLALEVLNQVAPNLTETERIGYVVKLLPPLNTIVYSEIEVSTDDTAV